MEDKIYITWTQIKEASRMIADNARDMGYDAVIGIQRGGLVPAVIISHELDIPMHSIKCSLRDHTGTATNINFDSKLKYLCVDDINDTGDTCNFLDELFDQHNLTVDYAVLHDNIPSNFSVDYWYEKINKDENPSWIVYPWEK